jgi:hypothetical protein
MAVQGLQQLDALIGELALLERRERELSDDRGRLHDRMDVGAPGSADRRERQAGADRLSLYRRIERQLSDERRALHRRIDSLRRQLGLPAPERDRQG